MTDEAKEQTLLSDSYYFSSYRAVSFDQHKLDVWHTLKIGISSGEDSSEDLPALNEKPENLISYDTVFVALSGLIQDEVDVVVTDSTVPLYNMNGEAVQQYKDKLFSKIIHEPEIDGSKLVFAIDKAHPDLQKKVNNGL